MILFARYLSETLKGMLFMRKFSNEDICDKLSMILESIDIIERRTVGISSGFDFMTSFERVTLFDSCVLRLQVIGEEVGKLMRIAESELSRHPEIPWQQIYSMRNFISHEYSHVDEDIVFQVIKDDLPPLKVAVKGILDRLTGDNGE